MLQGLAIAPFSCHTIDMNKATKPLTHIEHPEDLILTGETWVLDAIDAAGNASLKIDGCPAIIWGTNPDTGKFGVSTKSFFNKKKHKVCYTHADVDMHFGAIDNVCRILHACLDYLPRTEGLYQGDFIGFGGDTHYTPNVLTYVFPEVVTETIIMAPHTRYEVNTPVWTSVPHSNPEFFVDTPDIKWVQPIVDKLQTKPQFARFDSSDYNWLTKSQAAKAMVDINALIKSGQEVTLSALTAIIGDANLAALYAMVKSCKQQVMDQFIIYNAPKCYLDGDKVQGEGFVFTTEYGVIKLVDREQFFYATSQQRFMK